MVNHKNNSSALHYSLSLWVEIKFKFWQWTVLISLIIIGFIINLFDKKVDNLVNFKYTDYPHMKPIRIATKGKGFWGAIILWFFG